MISSCLNTPKMMGPTARRTQGPAPRRAGGRGFQCSVESLEARLALNSTASVAAAAEVIQRPPALVRAVAPGAMDRLHARAAARAAVPSDLQAAEDLRGTFAKIPFIPYNQMRIGSCTANAVGAAIAYKLVSDPSTAGLIAKGFSPSRLFLYYNGRFLDGHPVAQDSGTLVKWVLQSAESQGVASEGPATSTRTGATWPYVASQVLHKVNPGASNYLAARELRVTGFTRLAPGLDAIKSALASGQPVMLSIRVYQNFPSRAPRPSDAGADWLPTIPLPKGRDKGGHAILAVGYDDARRAFIILNSWGTDWGGNGYAYLPYAYASNEEWSAPDRRFTIQGVAIEDAPATIGELDDLTARSGPDTARGLVHIDTAPASSPGTATSFDFYEEASPGRSVTPLLFTYNASTATYTLSGIGRSYLAKSTGEQGIPFVIVKGSAAVGTDTVFGFVDGRLRTSKGGAKLAPNAGVVPYSSGVGSGESAWLTSKTMRQQPLKIGETFSVGHKAQVGLQPASEARVYSAMLVE